MNSQHPQERSIEVLLVEDSPSDAKLAREALSEGAVPHRLHHVCDGIDALEFLRREGQYGDAPRPDLILLDLKLPRKDGHEVLAEIRGDEELKHLVVVVLTTSSAASDLRTAYRLNCNAYIVKPMDLDQFFAVVRAIEQFCFQVMTLPPNETHGNQPTAAK